MKTDKSRMRDTTLGDAKKMGLYPSVTGIINLLAKPQLESWKIEQAILSALTLPPIDGETIDERAKRVVKDSQEQVKDAAKRGHLTHKAVEDYLVTGKWNPHPDVEELANPVKHWLDDNILEVFYSEKTLVGQGFAGRCDLSARLRSIPGRLIIDFKTRKPSMGKLRVYDEDAIQLCAYRLADADMSGDAAKGVASVIINSETPEPPTLHEWAEGDVRTFSEAFEKLFDLWILLKGYNPSTGQVF